MFRLLFMTFFGDYRGARLTITGTFTPPRQQRHDHGHGEPHESPMVMLVPLMILAVLSVVGGLVGHRQSLRAFSGACVSLLARACRGQLEKPPAEAHGTDC